MPIFILMAEKVIVIGAGLAGLTAAIELLEAGQPVLLLDRGPAEGLGGLARWAMGGLFYVDSPFQRKAGLRDSPERAWADWQSFAQFAPEDHWPRAWAEQYVHRCTPDVYEWLKPKGVRYIPSVQWLERGWHQPGNSVPRFHVVWGTGQGLVQCLLAYLDAHPYRDRLTLRFEQEVTDLIGDHQQVRGVRGRDLRNGEPFAYEGAAVILAAGGITGSVERVKRHWYAPWGTPPETLLTGSHPVANGDMHDLAARHGAQLTHLDRQWNYAAGVHHPDALHPAHGLSLVPPKTALWLDAWGERFGPDPMISGFDTRWLVEQVARSGDSHSWLVLNRKIALKELGVSGSLYNDAMRERKILPFLLNLIRGNNSLLNTLSQRCPDWLQANSVAALAQQMNQLAGNNHIDAVRLQAQLTAFDRAIAGETEDEQVRRIDELRQYRGDRLRTCARQPILAEGAGPLIAIRVFLLTRKSLGGLQTNLDSQVLTSGDSPIAGLYAVGEVAGFGGGGIHGLRALEGTFLGNCIFNARMAVRHILGKTAQVNA